MINDEKIIFKINNSRMSLPFDKIVLFSFWKYITERFSPKEHISLTWIKQRTYETVTYFCQNNKDEFLNILDQLEKRISYTKETQINNNNNNETFTKKGIVHYED